MLKKTVKAPYPQIIFNIELATLKACKKNQTKTLFKFILNFL